jgi:hypothetical protein
MANLSAKSTPKWAFSDRIFVRNTAVRFCFSIKLPVLMCCHLIPMLTPQHDTSCDWFTIRRMSSADVSTVRELHVSIYLPPSSTWSSHLSNRPERIGPARPRPLSYQSSTPSHSFSSSCFTRPDSASSRTSHPHPPFQLHLSPQLCSNRLPPSQSCMYSPSASPQNIDVQASLAHSYMLSFVPFALPLPSPPPMAPLSPRT